MTTLRIKGEPYHLSMVHVDYRRSRGGRGSDWYAMLRKSDRTSYMINTRDWSCTCPGYKHHQHCKHGPAVREHFEDMDMESKHLPVTLQPQSTALANQDPGGGVMTLQDTMTLGDVLARSGYFQDARSAAQAVVKILAGRELGFSPMASMTGVHIVEGKPTVGAHLLAAAIKRSANYDYRIVTATDKECELEFYERGWPKEGETIPTYVSVGKVAYSMQEAVESGVATGKDGKTLKANWRRHPDDMLFARCISKGYRRYCPDLSGGVLAYVTDEIDVQPIQVVPAEPAVDVTDTSRVNGTPMVQGQPVASQAAQVQEGGSDPTRARISTAQASELAALIRAKAAELKADPQELARELREHFKLPHTIAQLPLDRFVEAIAYLTPGQEQPVQNQAAPSATIQTTADPSKVGSTLIRVQSLMEMLRVSTPVMQQRLQALYQKQHLTQLTEEELLHLEDRLRVSLAVKKNPAPRQPAA